jgi:hypothetical protein
MSIILALSRLSKAGRTQVQDQPGLLSETFAHRERERERERQRLTTYNRKTENLKLLSWNIIL